MVHLKMTDIFIKTIVKTILLNWISIYNINDYFEGGRNIFETKTSRLIAGK